MHKTKGTKRSVTLIEMMIVMFLIAMIIGVVAFNYRGTLEEGKAFKTKAAIERIETILTLAQAEGDTEVADNWKEIIKNSPLVQNPTNLFKDGWGEEFDVTEGPEGTIQVTSRKFNEFKNKTRSSLFK